MNDLFNDALEDLLHDFVAEGSICSTVHRCTRCQERLVHHDIFRNLRIKKARNLLDKRSEYMPVGIAGRLQRLAPGSEVQANPRLHGETVPLSLLHHHPDNLDFPSNSDTILCTLDRLDTFPYPDFHKPLRGPLPLAPTRYPLCAMSTHLQKSGKRGISGAEATAVMEKGVFKNQDSATAVTHAAARRPLPTLSEKRQCRHHTVAAPPLHW